MSALSVQDLVVRYDGPPVVDGLSFTVEEGELVVLLGPSGSGKTSTLRALAGFEPAGGRVAVAGRAVLGPGLAVPPERRGLGFVFQDYALFPHLSVARNVGFGLRTLPSPERAARVAEMLELVEMSAFADRLPHMLSGGQQQRIALARAAAPRPTAILMDEPFSNLDTGLRDVVRERVIDWLRGHGASGVLVTHDQAEALAVADRLAVLHAGKLVRLGPPAEVFCDPGTATVARFLGRANLLAGTADGARATTVLGALPLRAAARGAVTICLRPHQIGVRPGDSGVVVGRVFAGADALLHVRVGEARITARVRASDPFAVGDRVALEALEAGAVVADV